ncbi:hypothetical protein SISSUDRAFT_1041805 [Sistotremastrum suecicum HHB10207 ss-3]|nr:hypothetical protein SISSUDRAFT_1041805 [Sistotremastrum suecicum HHB10207 ss-3]
MTTIAVLNEADLKDGQLKEVEFGEGGKVLLSKLGDKIHATSAFCTHYGAPLAKGVLTADGRVTCPWHGACFNVCTGDIEDAPAPDAIHSFKVEVSGGKIHVTADPKATLKENKSRTPTIRGETASKSAGPGVVIVGGGAGGFQTAESLRENGYSGKITILSQEDYAPIDRTKLSKALITDASKLQWRTPEQLRTKFGVDLKTGVTVDSLDLETKQVIAGNSRVPYETLVLAPGATPRRLPIDGANLENVFTLRTIPDAAKIDAAVKEGKRLVVIGSSFISMELVAAVTSRNLLSIDVIGMEEHPFEAVLGKEIGKALQKFHESKGVKFHMQAKVDKIVPKSADSNAVGAVQIPGKSLPADVVIMGVGVGPATSFLKDSGISLEKDGGVKVDEYLKVIGFSDIYAIGDIAHYPQHGTEDVRRVEHWNVASNHGRAVGKTIAGQPQPFVKVPIFWSAQGSQLRYCGIGAGFDDVIVDGNLDELKFAAYYAKKGKVIAVISIQKDPIVAQSAELLRLGLMPSVAEIRAGKSPLDVDISTEASKPVVA